MRELLLDHLVLKTGEDFSGKMRFLALLTVFLTVAGEHPVLCMARDPLERLYGRGNMTYFEGDIVLSREQKKSIEAHHTKQYGRTARAVVIPENFMWPNGVVPYVMSALLSPAAQSAIRTAIDYYSQVSCVRFLPRTIETDYVEFIRGDGCFSRIGRAGGRQEISIGDFCEVPGIAMHEIFHALGRWHEQSRPDRDQYVEILTQNILNGFEINFESVSSVFSTTNGVPYNFESIMHYSAVAFSSNGQLTISPLPPGVSPSVLGQREVMTSLDIQHVNALYCDVDSGSWSTWSSWTSCSRTCNGGIRTRQRSCSQASCEGENYQEEMCGQEPCQGRRARWSQWSVWGGCSASCEGGRQGRMRTCLISLLCRGSSVEYRDCNTQLCPGPALSQWGSWTGCSSSCRPGIRYRQRMCENGVSCSGELVESQYCNLSVPCTGQTGLPVGEWSEWSSCTRSCGGGVRSRHRCDALEACESEEEKCNDQPCNPEPQLQGLVSEGCYYLTSNNQELVSLERMAADLTDDARSRTEPIRKCGLAAHRYGHLRFALLLGNCIAGGNTSEAFTRSGSSVLCEGGIGGHFNDVIFAMNVYQITNESQFTTSAQFSAAGSAAEQAFTSNMWHMLLSNIIFFTVCLLMV